MSRDLFSAELGFEITGLNADAGVQIVFGSAAPGGDAGVQDAAPIGSLYIRQNGSSSSLYQKVASSNATSDWLENGSSSAAIGVWRPEKVRAITNDSVTAGVARDLVASPFADDEGTLLVAADFAVGEFIVADADGTPVLLEVTAISAPSVTFSTPASAAALSEGDTFVTANYLPDSPGDQEGQAIANYNGSVMVKIGDIDWNFADGINLASGYAAASGDVSDADTVQEALQKIDGNNDDQDTLLGSAQGDTDLGTFAGATIPDASSVKGALQSLETAHEEVDANVDDLISLSGMPENSVDLGTFTGATISDNQDVKGALQELETAQESSALDIAEIDQNVDDLITLSGVAENATDLGAFNGDLLADGLTNKGALQRIEDLLEELKVIETTGITTEVSIDEVPVATVGVCKWIVEFFEEATPANRRAIEVLGMNDGANADDTVYATLKLGNGLSGNAADVSVDVSGGNMRLRVSSNTAGITARVRRIQVTNI